MPVVGSGDRVPGPVGLFEILEDNARLLVLVAAVAPHVEVSPVASRPCAARPLEPAMLIGGVVQYQLRDHANAPVVSLPQEYPEVSQSPVVRVDSAVVGDVVAIVLERRGIEGEDPERRDTQVLKVVQLLCQAAEVPYPIRVAVIERPGVKLVDDGVLVPERIVLQRVGHLPSSHRPSLCHV
jgi:hypothetical protein